MSGRRRQRGPPQVGEQLELNEGVQSADIGLGGTGQKDSLITRSESFKGPGLRELR
jgi:hypothetical protein